MNKQIEEMRKEVASIHRFFLEDDDYESLDEYIADMLYNAGYRKQEWISVEQRLPDRDGKYLVYTSKGFIFAQGYCCTNSFGFESWDVTHWMPLPEAPKEGDKTDA